MAILANTARRCAQIVPVQSFLIVLAATGLLLPAVADARKVVQVSSVPELYKEVNDAKNVGALLLLAPITYRLDPTALNGGRLELQRDMGLQGMSGNPASTVIDASALTKASFTSGDLATGAVRLGRGTNSLLLLTVQNATNGASAITTDLVDLSVPAHVQITSVIARNNKRGLDVRNINADAAGRALTIDITTSVFTANTTPPGQGIRIANINAPGASIRANLSANQSYGNVAGCLSANLDTTDSDIVINSSADRFTGNGNGCVFIAGLRQGVEAVFDNSLTVTASASTFRSNTGALPAVFPMPGGIIAIGGQNVDSVNPSSDNKLAIDLLAVTMGDNHGTDITGFGAYSDGPLPAGTDNAVVLRLLATRASNNTIVDSVPNDPTDTNTIDVFPY